MTEQFKNDDPLASQQSETDIVVLIKKMQQQLTFLEKKIDILVSQSQEKPLKERHFSRPSRPFDRPYRPGGHYPDKREHGEGSRERSFRPGHYSDKREHGEGLRERSFRLSHHSDRPQGEVKRGFDGPRKEYSGNREGSSSPERHFEKKYDGKKKIFDPRKKDFFHKRKDR
jgi:hypothetical protein